MRYGYENEEDKAMSNKKKGIVIGLAMVLLVVLVGSVTAIDVEWECYKEGFANYDTPQKNMEL